MRIFKAIKMALKVLKYKKLEKANEKLMFKKRGIRNMQLELNTRMQRLQKEITEFYGVRDSQVISAHGIKSEESVNS